MFANAISPKQAVDSRSLRYGLVMPTDGNKTFPPGLTDLGFNHNITGESSPDLAALIVWKD